jgi:FMN phosphatase YigB (HAD superfamily)
MISDDLTSDIAGSRQLGILAIWCDYAKRGLPQALSFHPDRIIHALPELCVFLKTQANASVILL